MLDNIDAYHIFSMVRYQLIIVPGQAWDINHSAVWRLIDELKIKERFECFEKVCMLVRLWWIPKLNEKSEA